MPIIKCKMCGGDLDINDSVTVAECEYCGSMLGDIANLGVTLGAVGGVIDMTKGVISPVMDSVKSVGDLAFGANNVSSFDTWDCACGAKGIKSKFCPECGAPKEE